MKQFWMDENHKKFTKHYFQKEVYKSIIKERVVNNILS